MPPLLPLTENEQRRVRKVARGLGAWLVFFALLVPGFGFLFILTVTDKNFRASDGYVVAGFTGLMVLVGVVAMWGGWRTKARMDLILASNQKQVLAGQVTNVTVRGTSQYREYFWEIKGFSQPIAICPISPRALIGLKFLDEVAVGDWVEVHQAATVPLAVGIVKRIALAGAN